jgi:hypothetical protein
MVDEFMMILQNGFNEKFSNALLDSWVKQNNWRKDYAQTGFDMCYVVNHSIVCSPPRFNNLDALDVSI